MDKAKYFESAGNLLLEKKDWKNAKSMFQNALLLEESCWFKPYYGLAESLEKLGDIDEAIANYRKSIEIKPDFAWNYYRLSSIFSHQDALDDALSNIERAIELHPYEKSFSLYLALGDILLRKGKLEAAESAYLEAENIYPDSLQSKGRLSCLYAKLNDRERQELYLQQAIDKASDQCQAYILLGDAFWRGGLAEKSIEFYQKGVALDVDNSLNAKKRLEQAKDKSL
ncbi:MAG: tetratricopeptide repeat protein, partial [Synechococcales cyanobacterium RM1_1_8]|nr:tetratricopeptide repeat protein [Synechococcales cyanobacterium RM1_1_8]